MRLQGKNAIVTGASRGIGRAIALSFAKEGANIAFTYTKDEEGAGITRRLLEDEGVRALAVCADGSDEEQAAKLVKEATDGLGPVHILVNNAGITRDNLLLRMSADDFDRVLDVNLKSAFLLTKACARGMMKQRYGKIINISSVVGVFGNAGQANYAASKAGLIGLTKTVAKELGSRGIRVNAVAPGFIQTDMTEALPEEVKEKMLGSVSLGSFGTPDDVAALCVFLASGDADYITGQVLHVDGGMA
ncbi:MAG: 3-oxoacyl-[acyl-carrier-protein] reductase [Tissierellia bacterium]|jgi:3-oxoacyl-[acyl-carrier protein] reductase|nr:3-oxoacyl-[acyl-carrier-protein] reductase [Bacillota bacterium]NLK58662.1 3-oxoacyl-[acyl-carrier-protein] reductase [Tissierellia bacterium]